MICGLISLTLVSIYFLVTFRDFLSIFSSIQRYDLTMIIMPISPIRLRSEKKKIGSGPHRRRNQAIWQTKVLIMTVLRCFGVKRALDTLSQRLNADQCRPAADFTAIILRCRYEIQDHNYNITQT